MNIQALNRNRMMQQQRQLAALVRKGAMYQHDEEWDTECPQCQIGCLEPARWPYLELYQGHLFTVPDAICYVCDVCGYHEFDTTVINLIGDMVERATMLAADADHKRPFRGVASSEEDVSGKPPQPQA